MRHGTCLGRPQGFIPWVFQKWGKYYPHFIPHPHFSTKNILVNFFFSVTYLNAENKEQILMPRDETTKNRVRSAFWMVTSFEENPPKFDNVTMHFMRVGREICPDTKTEHWHAAVQFRDMIRFNTVTNCFPKQNVGAEKGNHTQFYGYVMKDGEFIDSGTFVDSRQGDRNDLDLAEVLKAVEDGMSLYDIMRQHPAVACKSLNYVKLLIAQRDFRCALGKRKLRFGNELREWQSNLKETIEQEPDDRTVHWFIDRDGNAGKSYMCGYLQSHHGAFVSTGGKVADIAHAYDKERIVIFDLPRSMEKSKDIYILIEGFKNGCIFSPKYESSCKIFDVPHVIVFANWEPDMTSLSRDRWKITDFDEPDEDSIYVRDAETYGPLHEEEDD